MNVNEAIDDLYAILGQHNGEYMDYASYEAAVDNLNIISNFVAGTRWIPVSERLPTKEDAKNNRAGYVLVHRKSSAWDFDMCKWHNVEYLELATHWMPLPNPPQEVE